MESKYTLICDKCGKWFYSKEAFPSPQLCPKCQKESDEENAKKKDVK